VGSKDSLVLYPVEREIYFNDGSKERQLSLSDPAFDLLKFYMENAGKFLTSDEILLNVEKITNNHSLSHYTVQLGTTIGEKYFEFIPQGVTKFLMPVNGLNQEIIDRSISISDLIYDEQSRTAFKNGEKIPILLYEGEVIKILASRPDRRVSDVEFMDELNLGIQSVKMHCRSLALKFGTDPNNKLYLQHALGIYTLAA